MKNSHEKPKEFWKLLNMLSCKKDKISSYVSHTSLFNHFKSLLNTNECKAIPLMCKESGPLDYLIIPDDLKKASECRESCGSG